MILLKLKKAVGFTAFFLIGCVSEQTRLDLALNIAAKHEFSTQTISGELPIQIFYKNYFSKHAVIYLEGDGLVINKYGEVALNPTPTDPMALRLASIDERPISKIVVNRPFQYIAVNKNRSPENLTSKYWTTARYSNEVIQAILVIIKTYQQLFRFDTIEIVAYSGGAAVALLLAPELNHLTRIVSFAGNLDHVSWTRYHDTQPLIHSLDPLQNIDAIVKVPQIHFVGTDDDNTTLDLAHYYQQQLASNNVKIVPVSRFSHDSDWPQIWQRFINHQNDH